MLKLLCLKGLIMEIVSKLVEIEAQAPIDNNYIEKKIRDMGIEPLRWAIVKVKNNILTISLAYENTEEIQTAKKTGFFRALYENL